MERRDEQALQRFQRMQRWRGPRDRDVTINAFLKQFTREQTKTAKALGHVTEAFEAVVPGVLLPECRLVGLRAGILSIETRSASVQFTLDRFLREGGERDLCQRAALHGARITKVRVVCAHDRE